MLLFGPSLQAVLAMPAHICCVYVCGTSYGDYPIEP